MANKTDAAAFAEYLQSMVKIDSLERMTQDLEHELADSQKIMKDIKMMFNTIPPPRTVRQETGNNGLRHEDLSTFLEAGVPKLLLPDMTSIDEVDLDDAISTMKSYAEELKKKTTGTPPQFEYLRKDMKALGLEQYATNLDQLSKRLANIKLNKRDTLEQRNPELEGKLTLLCQDVNMFTQMVQAKTTLGEHNENWKATEHNPDALQYDEIVSKLLSGINEVSYLLQNNNS